MKETFSHHLKRLETIVARLQNDGDMVAVDDLIPMIKEAGASYQFCKQHLAAIDTILNEHMRVFEDADIAPAEQIPRPPQ